MPKLPKFPKTKEPDELSEGSKKRRKRKTKLIKVGTTQEQSSSKPKRAKHASVRRVSSSKKKTKRKRTTKPVLTKTRANVKATIKRAEKRGFRFSDSLKDYVNRATLSELRSLQKNKYKSLYEQSTAIGAGGYLISGTERRREEVREAALKGAETRRRNKKKSVPESTIREAQERVVPENTASKTVEETIPEMYEEPEELYSEGEVIENEPTFEAEEKARQLDFEVNKDSKEYRDSLALGDVAWDTINDVISDYERMGAGLFGKYFKDMMLYYEKRYSIETIKYAISLIYEDYLEIAQDIIFYNNNILELINSVNNLKQLIDQALVYSGLTPDFNWKMSFEEVKDREALDFMTDEEYPY